MSNVKRFDAPSMRSLIQGDQAVMGYEVVLASDYDDLAAEAQALREEVAALKHSQQVLIGSRNAHRDERDAARKEVAALRARVVVLPEPVTMDGTTTIREYVANAVPKDTPMDKWTQGYEECKRRIHAMFEQPCNKRLNGLTVSEGLLRRLCEPLLSHADYVVARNELRALLSEQE
ncbi:TPA: hypothetical protein VDT13_006026 [Pseudomonas aeruginosa]|nr:hypothetical protein [Pseudomonas aeruginosa]